LNATLYKRESGLFLYLQAWACEGRVAIHSGEVGIRGQTVWIDPDLGKTTDSVIETAIQSARANGFAPVPYGEMFQVILTCPTGPDWTSDEVFGVGRYLEEMCNERLGWTGLGYCDGPSYGPRSVGVYSLVVDLELGIREMIAELRLHGCEGKDEELVLSVPDGDRFRVVYTTGPPVPN
jgi:hypothetical protein